MDNKTVPYIAFEAEMARMERIIRRLVWIAAACIVLLVGTNVCWIIYESQYENSVTTTTVEADATDGGNAVITRDGTVTINGAGESNNDN